MTEKEYLISLQRYGVNFEVTNGILVIDTFNKNIHAELAQFNTSKLIDAAREITNKYKYAPWQQRVITERDELNIKLNKLIEFNSDDPLLIKQIEIMKAYLTVLDLRIGQF